MMNFWSAPDSYPGWAGPLLALSIQHNRKADTCAFLFYLERRLHLTNERPCGRGDLFHAIIAFNQGQCPKYIKAIVERVIDLVAWDCSAQEEFAKTMVLADCVEFYTKVYNTTPSLRIPTDPS